MGKLIHLWPWLARRGKAPPRAEGADWDDRTDPEAVTGPYLERRLRRNNLEMVGVLAFAVLISVAVGILLGIGVVLAARALR